MGSSPTNSEKSQISGPSSLDVNGEFMASFWNLGLANSGETCRNNNNGGVTSSLGVSSEQGSQKEDTFCEGQFNVAPGKWPVSSWMFQGSPESPISQENNIWAYHLQSIDAGGYLPSNRYLDYDPVTSPRTPMSCYSSYGSPPASVKSLIMSYSNYGSPSTPSFSNQLQRSSFCDDATHGDIYGMGIDMPSGNNSYPSYEVYFPNEYNVNNNGEKSGGSSFFDFLPEGVDLAMVAKTFTGSKILKQLLGSGNDETRKRIFSEVFKSIPELMTDPNGHDVFQKLVETSKGDELLLIVKKLSENQFLVDAAFNKQGSYSIQKLIKKLGKSPMASLVTKVLSTSFLEMMTHPIARHVIRQCLNHFTVEQNMVLFEEAIKHCHTLATHHVGCISMNNCIDFITGAQRERLLQLLADHPVYLANDPSGNFVVQRVLNTRNPLIVDKVCNNLRGQYKQVSRNKGGSHVVELCIRYSSLGMTCAVQEFLESTKDLAQLAKDQFGNFVIQTTLRVTKHESIQLYQALVYALKPYLSFLEHFKTAKNVVALVKENLGHLETRKCFEEEAKDGEREDYLMREGSGKSSPFVY